MDAHANFTKDENTIRMSIACGDVVPVHDGRGARLHVESGVAWVTQNESPEDVFLSAGESFRIEREGLTLVSAVAPTPFTLATLEPSMRAPSTLMKRIAAGFMRAWMAIGREPARHFIYPYY